MKDDELELRPVDEESRPPVTRGAGLPLVFENLTGGTPPDSDGTPPAQDKTLTLRWLYGRCVTRMRCSGCPLASQCGHDLAHDILVELAGKDLSAVNNIEAFTSTVIGRRAINKKEKCKCDLAVPFAEYGDVDEDDHDESQLPPTIPLSKYPAEAITPEQDRAAALILEAVLARLRPDERRLFVLVRWEGRSEMEAAARLGINYAAARKRVERLDKRLVEIFRSITL